jgi:peptide-methionine (R)-S-oxide reductase
MDKETLKKKLSDEQFHVTQNAGTERAFTGKYVDHKADGTYHCVCCDAPLFSSENKYDSGSGWPSFWLPLAGDAVRTNRDESHGMVRIEVVCSNCGAHLGHVFEDGPQPTGLRYCVNSASLDFKDA